MIRIKAVIFDFGGVVVNSSPHCLEFFVSKIFEIPLDEVQKGLFTQGEALIKGEITDDQFWHTYSHSIKKTLPASWKELFHEFHINTTINSKVIQTVKELKRRGLITPILSNISQNQVNVFKKNNYFDLFEPLIFSCEVGLMKPDPRIFIFAANKLKLQPEECVFIDDDEKNVRQAQKLGMHGIRFTPDFDLDTLLL